jgi:hypothetical protein
VRRNAASDISGSRFGLLTAVSKEKAGRLESWLCQCDCGRTHTTRRSSLIGGYTKSCGCARPPIRLGFDVREILKPCLSCGTRFRPMYAHETRKYCSQKCAVSDPAKASKRSAHIKAMVRVAIELRKLRARVQWCMACGAKLKVADPRTETCGSSSCMAEIRGRKRREGLVRRYGARKDKNHAEIVAALEAGGCQTIDMSSKGDGFPDLVVCRRRITYLVEIKGNNQYGKKPNKNQLEWASSWPSPVWILRTIGDVEKFINGKLGELESYGGRPEVLKLMIEEALA